MHVFVTGGTGYIGSAVVRELVTAGHQVTALARSESAAARLVENGVTPVPGSLHDLDTLQTAARRSDGVIHVAFSPDFADFANAVTTDRRVVNALGEALAGSDRPLVVPSGTALMRAGVVLDENDPGDPATAGPRRETEQDLLRLSANGVRGSIVRLGTSVHGPADTRGFIPGCIAVARRKGVSAFVGNGDNRWPAVHQLDAARLFRLAAESAAAGSTLHAIADTDIAFRDIAGAIARHLDIPAVSIDESEVAEHFDLFGDLAFITGCDIPASSDITRTAIGWEPVHPGLIADLEDGCYFDS